MHILVRESEGSDGIMGSQGEITSLPLDMQLKWALRHGKSVGDLENMLVSTEKVVPTENNIKNNVGNDTSIHNPVVEGKIDKLNQMINQEINLLRSEVAVALQNTVSEEQLEKLTTTITQEILALKSELAEWQVRLVEDRDYIQYVLEEIATRPQNMDAQQKLREKFLIREMVVLKEKMELIYKACQGQENSSVITEAEIVQKVELSMEKDKKRRKR